MTNTISTRIFKVLTLLALGAGGLVGCAQIPLAAPQPTMTTVEALRGTQVAPVAVGDFKLAPGKPASLDKGVDVRSNNVHSPYGDSLSLYLKEVLTTELRAAGKLDANSGVTVAGWLTDSKIDAGGFSTSTGALAAKFEVRRAGSVVYEKEFSEKGEWPSSFVGAIAIPAAVNGYTALFKSLVGRLVSDPAFAAATTAK